MAIYLSEEDISGLLTMSDALEVLEEMFIARSRGEVVNKPRVRIPFPGGHYNVMPASWAAHGVVGHKSYTASARGAAFHIMLYATDGNGLLAVMSAGTISGLRTGAATGLAAKILAGPSAGDPVALIGTGFQAVQQVNGVLAATGASEMRAWSRDAMRRNAFATRMAEETGVDIRATGTIEDALHEASIVVVITNAHVPVLSTSQVTAGQTVIAAGNNTWLNSEIDPSLFKQADLIVVDDVENARAEAGELMRATESAMTTWDRVVPLGDIISGARAGRTSDQEIIVCELQGIGIEDVAMAELAYRRAREHGIGLELPA